MDGYYLGIFEGHADPAVALVRDGEVLAYAEEERFLRYKHAYRVYPARALAFCLDQAGIGPDEVAAIGVNWDVTAFTDGRMGAFFEQMAEDWPLDPKTLGWQRAMLGGFNRDAINERHAAQWRRLFGAVPMPRLHDVAHHRVHALQAFLQSPFEEALTLTVDGSGDAHCTVLWACRGETIAPLRRFAMPHSLGWFYAAFTEYLGFEAYDGEYKVMGLAAYGEPDPALRAKVDRILLPDDDGVGYRLDPGYIHYGPRSWSDRFTDALPDLFGRPRRLADAPIEAWHRNLAFAVQQALEEAVCRLAGWGLAEMGTGNLCIGGGVGLNVKMNSRLFALPAVERIFPQPLCSDGGAAVGAALGAAWESEGARPRPLETLALGSAESDAEIEAALARAGLPYRRCDDIAAETARELAAGRIVAWLQGRMEAGPRALGQRSILADPRRVEVRDRVNEAIKYREPWRPFCPAMLAEAAPDYLETFDHAPFMTIAFDANARLRREAPAIVHVDGSVRVQMVARETLPLFHRLISCFAGESGVPVLLNTSFNVKGEPIVRTVNDALRTFFSTGLEVLAAGSFLLRKEDMR